MKKKSIKTSGSQVPLSCRAGAATLILSSIFLAVGFLLLTSDSSFVRNFSYVLLLWGFSGIFFGAVELYRRGNRR